MESGLIIPEEYAVGEDWLRRMRTVEKKAVNVVDDDVLKQRVYVPEEDRIYLSEIRHPEKLPKELIVYEGERGGKFIDRRQLEALVGREEAQRLVEEKPEEARPEERKPTEEIEPTEEWRPNKELVAVVLRHMERRQNLGWEPDVTVNSDGSFKVKFAGRKEDVVISEDLKIRIKGQKEYYKLSPVIMEDLKKLLDKGMVLHLETLLRFDVPNFAGSIFKKTIEKFGNVENLVRELEERKKKVASLDLKFEAVSQRGKYSPQMGLKALAKETLDAVNNIIPEYGVRLLCTWWYNGNKDTASTAAQALKDVVDGEFDMNNIMHANAKIVVELSKVMAEKHGESYIYRGETSPETAEKILDELGKEEKARISGFASWTENEKLAKWYASVHSQETAEGRRTKTFVVLRLDKQRYLPHVVMYWKIFGQPLWPEEEVTLYAKNIEISRDDVFVYGEVSGKKGWMTLKEYLNRGGKIDDLKRRIVWG